MSGGRKNKGRRKTITSKDWGKLSNSIAGAAEWELLKVLAGS